MLEMWERLRFACLIVLMSAVPAQAQLMLHNDASRTVDCMIRAGDQTMGLSVFRVLPVPAGGAVSAKPLCDHLPEVGAYTLTIDLLEPAWREHPLAVRLVRESDGGETVLQNWPAWNYSSGSVMLQATFAEPGRYALILETEARPPLTFRIPLHVAQPSWRFATLLLAVILGATGFYFWRKRRSP